MSPEPEFGHSFDLATVGTKPVAVALEPAATQRSAIAERLGLMALDRLMAEITLKREADGETIRLDGLVEAHLVQPCSRTLEPVPTALEDRFTERLRPVPAGTPLDEQDLDADALVDADYIEPVPGGVIDLGELMVQYLALAIPIHPVALGAVFEGPSVETTPLADTDGAYADGGRHRPFADLAARLKRG